MGSETNTTCYLWTGTNFSDFRLLIQNIQKITHSKHSKERKKWVVMIFLNYRVNEILLYLRVNYHRLKKLQTQI